MSVVLEEALADLACHGRLHDLPAHVLEYAQALTVDALANAVAGRSAETVAQFEAATAALCGPGRHAVCAGRRLAAWAATAQNSYQMTVYTMCDVYRPALCHVTPEVVPAALAAAELAGASGAEFLTAVALGFEVTVRVCLALDYPSFRARGWHSPGVAGALGAAAAAGRLLGLSTGAMIGCLGLAGAHAAGTFAGLGTVAVKFHQVSGARAGLSAAVYAANGFAGSQRILSARDGGIMAACSGGGTPGLALAGLGDSWELYNISMRAYCAASTLQALVDCLRSEPARHRWQAGQVTGATVWLPPYAYLLGTGGWETQLTAMQSARYVTAAVLHRGDCWLDSFAPKLRADPVLTGFAARSVDVRADEGLEEGGVRVLLSGPRGDLELQRDYPHGDSRDRLTTAEVHEKARRSLAVLPPGRRAPALAALAALPAHGAISTLTARLTAGGRMGGRR